MNKGTVIRRMLLISIGILVLTGATIHMQGDCMLYGYDGKRMEKAASMGKGEVR